VQLFFKVAISKFKTDIMKIRLCTKIIDIDNDKPLRFKNLKTYLGGFI